MSDRARRFLSGACALASACLAATFSTTPVAAQQRAGSYDAQAAQARTLYGAAVAHVSALTRTIDSLEEDLRRKHTTDSVHAGGIMVRIVGEPLPAPSRAALDRAAVGAWGQIERLRDTAVESAIARAPLELAVDALPRPVRSLGFSLGFPKQVSSSVGLGRGSVDEADAQSALLWLYGGAVGARLPRSFVKWLSTDWVSLVPASADDWQRVATQLATSRSSIARSCLTTEPAACRTVLELQDVPATDPRVAWYRPEDYPALVSEWNPRDSASNALRVKCVRDGVAPACASAMTLMPLVRPLDAFPKVALLMFAIDRGGAGAYQRLINATGTPAEMLATTARMPIDDLVGAWRAAAVAAPVPRSRPGVAELAAIGAWTLVFGALAVRRRP